MAHNEEKTLAYDATKSPTWSLVSSVERATEELEDPSYEWDHPSIQRHLDECLLELKRRGMLGLVLPEGYDELEYR